MNTSDDTPVVVYTTFCDAAEAERIGSALVEEKLAGCVNLLAGMTSIYEWRGRISKDTEIAAIIKSRQGRAGRIIERVREMHSYDTPAFLVLPVIGGSEDYIGWIVSQTQS